MARLWRITSKKWALDTSCEGARLYGGRWNPIGYPVMYAGSTIELCALEKFVHLAGVPAPPLVLVAIDVPDDESLITRVLLPDMPPGWSDLPMSTSAHEFGRAWLDAAAQLILMVPSTIVPEAFNAVINPAHPAYKKIRLQILREFSFDARMWKT
ncbi:MAG: RES family NAD+ phosphorylase [Pseudomonadota bacterium]